MYDYVDIFEKNIYNWQITEIPARLDSFKTL